jgi:hypothetical protein
MIIGQEVTLDEYTDAALWCKENNATIEEIDGKYYIKAIDPPSKESIIAELDLQYRAEKANLCEAYTAAQMQGDTETAASVAADLADLDAWYDDEYERIVGGE